MKVIRNKFKIRPHVTGGGLALARTPAGKVVLGVPGAPESIGTYDDVVDAWKALDEIDLHEVDAGAESIAA